MALYKPPSWPGREQVMRDIYFLEDKNFWPNGGRPLWAQEIATEKNLIPSFVTLGIVLHAKDLVIAELTALVEDYEDKEE